MRNAIEVRAQTCVLLLVGGYVQRPGDPASPVYHGKIATASGAMKLEIRTEPGGLYDPRGLVDMDGEPAFGSGWWADADVDDTILQPIEGSRDRLSMTMDAQTVELRRPPGAAAYRVKVVSGTLRTDAGDWDLTMLGDFLTMSIGYGAYQAT